MTDTQKKETWEEEFGEKIKPICDSFDQWAREHGYSNPDGETAIAVKAFITKLLEKQEAEHRTCYDEIRKNAARETAKAYGGCEHCFGKGYATQIEKWSGHGEADMGQGDVVINAATKRSVKR